VQLEESLSGEQLFFDDLQPTFAIVLGDKASVVANVPNESVDAGID